SPSKTTPRSMKRARRKTRSQFELLNLWRSKPDAGRSRERSFWSPGGAAGLVRPLQSVLRSPAPRALSTITRTRKPHKRVLEKVLEKVEADGGRGMIFQADVTRNDQVAAMVAAIQERWTAVDVLVNNAYFPFTVGQLHELPWESFHQAVEHELSAFHNCAQAC